MTRSEYKTQIIVFKSMVDNYRRTLLNNGPSSLPEDVRMNLALSLRSQLNQRYGKIGLYINAVTGGPGSAYLTAFSDGGSSVIGALTSVIDNLDWITGKLDSISDDEFDALVANEKRARHGENSIYGIERPHRQYWGMISDSAYKWVKQPVSQIIIGVLVIATAAWFGLK